MLLLAPCGRSAAIRSHTEKKVRYLLQYQEESARQEKIKHMPHLVYILSIPGTDPIFSLGLCVRNTCLILAYMQPKM